MDISKLFSVITLCLAYCISASIAAPVITNTHLSPANGSFSAGDVVVDFTGSGVSVAKGSAYYVIDGQTVKLTAVGATLVNSGAPFPTLTLGDGSQYATLYSAHFNLSDDVSVGYANGGKTQDGKTNLIRTKDATSTSPSHYAAYLKATVQGIATETNDQIVHAKLNLFTANGNSAEAGTLSLFGLKDKSWTKDTITYTNRPYSASDPKPNGILNTALNKDFGTVNIDTTEGKRLSFDIASVSKMNDTHSFLVLSANEPDASASGTKKQGSQRHYIHSAEADTATLRPYLAISYVRNSNEIPATFTININEGSNSLLLTTRLISSSSTTSKISKVNNTAWAALAKSTHITYANEFGYKQITGTHGTLYLRDTGLAFYVHNGQNLASDVSETFNYEITDGTNTFLESLKVNIKAGNQAPTIEVFAKNFNPNTTQASAGNVVANYSVSDPDGDTTDIYWLTHNGRSPRHQNTALYQIDRTNKRILLTQKGADRVNALKELPPIPLTVVDNATDRKSAAKTAYPYVAVGRSFYIDKANGNDNNNGLSYNTAFASLDKVLDKVNGAQFLQANDTVYIIGKYTAPDFNESYVYNDDPADPYIWRNSVNTMKIRDIHGAAGQPITFKAWDQNTQILSDDGSCITVDSSTYIRIIGFEAIGPNERMGDDAASALQFLYRVDISIANYNRSDYDIFIKRDGGFDYFYRAPKGASKELLEQSYSQPNSLNSIKNTKRPIYTNTKGILVVDSQHVDVLYNTVHHTPGTGIRAQKSEMVRILNNEVHNCTRKASVGTMGIVARETTDNIAVAADKSNIYKIIIANNTVHHNFNEIYSWVPNKTFMTPHLDEGKGISLEWQDHPSWLEAGKTGRILIANNITYLNGLSGVNCHGSGRVDVVANTSFLNSLYSTIFELSGGNNVGITHEPDNHGQDDLGTDVRFWNNLAVADSNGSRYALRVNKTSPRVADGYLSYDGGYNLVWDYQGREVRRSQENIDDNVFLPLADPQFVDPANLDLRIKRTSPARNAANSYDSSWKLPSLMNYDARELLRANADVGGLEQIKPKIGFNAWLIDQLTTTNYDQNTNLGRTDDFDGDGISNLHEYAFGTDPEKADSKDYYLRMPKLTQNANGQFELRYAIPLRPRIDLEYLVQKASVFQSWETMLEKDHTITDENATPLVWKTWKNVMPENITPDKKFFRLKFTEKP